MSDQSVPTGGPLRPEYYSAPGATPLGPEQLLQLAAAKTGANKVNRAVNVALFDAWSLAIFAGLTLTCGFSSILAILMGLGMGTVATVEFIGARRLRRLDSTATRMLGMNQVALAGLLIAYAIWSLLTPATSAMITDAINQAGVSAQMEKTVSDLTRQIMSLVYGCLIAVAVFVQGGMAFYYFTREKYITAYRQQTPEWILQMQRAGIRL